MRNGIESTCCNALTFPDRRTIYLRLNSSNFHDFADVFKVIMVQDVEMSENVQACVTYDPPGPSDTGYNKGVSTTYAIKIYTDLNSAWCYM